MLTITTTATIRPDILRRTLESFNRNMLHGEQCYMAINVDPVGDEAKTVHDVVEVCRQYFRFNVDARTPARPYFPKAFLWCWERAVDRGEPYVLNLEDDWELLITVDLRAMIEELEQQPNLALLRLSAFRSGTHNAKHWNKFLDWNGRFFEVAEQDRRRIGFCGHPSIIKTEWIKQVLPLMVNDRNPEKQLQFPEHNSQELLETVLKWRYGVWQGQDEPAQIKDLGRGWIAGAGWQKSGNKAFFTEWCKQERA